VNFIDVGQGDAMLAEFPGRYFVLLDAGPRTAEDDAGKRVVVPYLKRCGVDHLDLVIISHPHADHAGGIPSVLHEFPVARVVAQHPSLASAALREFGGDGSVLIDSVRAGENLLGTSMARLYVVYPIDGQSATSASGNESLVLKLQYGVCSFLLTGDAERDEERCMVDTYGSFLNATVLKAGHHGSNTSSSEPFLECVRPNDVVISVGKYNRFHHPSPAMIGRARSRNATVLRTDESGAIIVDTDGNSLQQVEWR
jgi:competence protein ComEC